MNEIWEALSNVRRRRVIERVDDVGAVTKSALAYHLAEQEFGEGFDTSERKAVYVSLHQTHLEKLDDAGLVDYREEKFVVPTDLTADVVDWMDTAPWVEKSGGLPFTGWFG